MILVSGFNESLSQTFFMAGCNGVIYLTVCQKNFYMVEDHNIRIDLNLSYISILI